MTHVSDECSIKIKTHILHSINFCSPPPKKKNFGTAGQATDDNIIRRTCFACWITKATNTQVEYVIFIGFTRIKLGKCALITRLYIHYPSCFNSTLLKAVKHEKEEKYAKMRTEESHTSGRYQQFR